jgi:hypothetical protein
MKGWKQSEQWRQIARAAIQEYNGRRDTLPKCGALARHTGQPCRNIALANGRCRFHGGRTPSGDQWHKVRWPDRKHARAEHHYAQKLKRLARVLAEKERRLAQMSQADRDAYSLWQATHRAGLKSERVRTGKARRHSREALDLLRSMPAEPFDGAADLETLIVKLEAQLSQLSPEAAPPEAKVDIFS